MRKDLYSEMFVQEKTYWWHVAKRRLIHAAMKKVEFSSSDKIFDAGCGTGAMLEELGEKSPFCFGADVSSRAIDFCQKKGLKNVKKINFEKRLPYPNGYFKIITCLDVLEHVSLDEQLLREFYRILAPGGRLYLTVPAYDFFWTYWDKILGHKRRYRRSFLIKLLASSGFGVKRASYFYSFLVPVVLIFRLVKSVTHNRQSDFVQIHPILNNILLGLCQLERRVLFCLPIPLGLSIFFEAKKD